MSYLTNGHHKAIRWVKVSHTTLDDPRVGLACPTRSITAYEGLTPVVPGSSLPFTCLPRLDKVYMATTKQRFSCSDECGGAGESVKSPLRLGPHSSVPSNPQPVHRKTEKD